MRHIDWEVAVGPGNQHGSTKAHHAKRLLQPIFADRVVSGGRPSHRTCRRADVLNDLESESKVNGIGNKRRSKPGAIN